jgi:hypothetical protein
MDRLYADTKLGDTATRLAWLDKSPAEFEASTDPFIQLAVAMYPADIARERAAKERSGMLQAARAAYMRGMLAFAAASGKTLYPDANGSLRFTHGKVTGKNVDGENWTPFTTAEGLAAKQTGKGEFRRPRQGDPADQGQGLWSLRLARAWHPAGRLPVDGGHHQRQFGLLDAECARRVCRPGL